MKAFAKTFLVALVIAGAVGIFAGMAVAAPAEGPASKDQYRLEPTGYFEAIQIQPQLLVDVLQCDTCPEATETDPEAASVTVKEVELSGPVPHEVVDTPEIPATPETPDNPDKPDTPDTPDNPDTPATPEIPMTPEEPETPPVTEEEPPATSSKLPNTGTRVLFLALAALALIGAAPFAGMWIDARLNNK
jgi:hypothetical protein